VAFAIGVALAVAGAAFGVWLAAAGGAVAAFGAANMVIGQDWAVTDSVINALA